MVTLLITVCVFVSNGCLLANGQELSPIQGEEGDCSKQYRFLLQLQFIIRKMIKSIWSINRSFNYFFFLKKIYKQNRFVKKVRGII
jgi:hypothetical protein